MYPSLRRQPSPGHQNIRQRDEREAKRQRGASMFGGRAPILGPGGIGPEWTWGNGSGSDSILSFDKGTQKQYTPDPDHLYLNATVFGRQLATATSTGVDPTSSIAATFDQTYDKVLLQKPSDFKMGVVRFSVPISAVPIQYYSTGTAAVAAQVFDNGGAVHSYGPIAIGRTSAGTALNSVVYTGEDPASNLPAPASGATVPGYPNGGVGVWSVQDFLNALNNALYQLTAQMYADRAANNWVGTNPGGPAVAITPGAPPTVAYLQNQPMPPDGALAPYMSFDPATNLFQLSYEQLAWSGVNNSISRQTGVAALYFNYTLFQSYFSTFPGFYTQTPRPTALPAGFDVQVQLIQDSAYSHPTEGAVVNIPNNAGNTVDFHADGTLHVTQSPIPTGLQFGDMVVVSGIFSKTGINGTYQVASINNGTFSWVANRLAVGAPDTIAAPWAAGDLPSYIRVPRWMQFPGQTNTLVQETETVSAWSTFVALRLVTSSVPVRPEYVPTSSVNPSGPGQLLSPVFYTQQTIQQSTGQYTLVTGGGGSPGNPIPFLLQPAAQTGTSTVNTQTIMVDFLPEDLGKLELRNVISYVSRETYRWVDLIGDQAMQRFDVTAQWVDRFGNAFTLTVSPDEVFDVKFLFQHKYA